MSLVSSSNLMASFSGAFSHANRMFGGKNGGMNETDLKTAIIAEVVEEVMFNNPPVTRKTSGLRRTKTAIYSSMQEAAECSHTNNNCVMQAKQVEMDFANLTNEAFQMVILAPNSERSQIMRFNSYGQTARFCPFENGCGHGYWIIEICVINQDKKLVKKNEERIFLDGVGSLFYTVDENFQIKLISKDFLRLPSASQCAFNAKQNITKSIDIARK